MMTVEEFQKRGGNWKDDKEFVSNDKFTSVNNDDIIKSIGVGFRTVDDPMREVMDATEQSIS